jgi:hypothetical protein
MTSTYIPADFRGSQAVYSERGTRPLPGGAPNPTLYPPEVLRIRPKEPFRGGARGSGAGGEAPDSAEV